MAESSNLQWYCRACREHLGALVLTTRQLRCYVFQGEPGDDRNGQKFHNRNAMTTIMDMDSPPEPECDFCGSHAIVTEFRTRPGEYKVPIPGSDAYVDDGRWAACQPCADLVHAGDRDALRRRIMRAKQVPAAELSGYTKFVIGMQSVFWNNYLGEVTA